MYALNDVSIYLGLCSLSIGPKGSGTDPNPPHDCIGSLTNGPRLTPGNMWLHHKLYPDEKYSIDLDDYWHNMGMVHIDANISIIVSYKILGIPHEEEFKFYTRQLEDGKLHWFSKPVDG